MTALIILILLAVVGTINFLKGYTKRNFIVRDVHTEIVRQRTHKPVMVQKHRADRPVVIYQHGTQQTSNREEPQGTGSI